MIETIILGSGNLSNELKKNIVGSKVYTAKNFLKKISFINKNKKINLIINSFYSAVKLKKITSYGAFVNKSVFETAKILDLLNPKIINKIIYTSSSSVYGLKDTKINLKDDNNRNIYAAFKFSTEFLIKNFCEKSYISFAICRLFNMYGGNDKFSVILKRQTAIQKKQKIIIFNNGKSIRDYIHIDDVVTVYDRLIKKKIGSALFDVGTGKGVSLIELIKKLNFKKKNIIYKKKTVTELSKSIADNRNLIKKINKMKFKKLNDYV